MNLEVRWVWTGTTQLTGDYDVGAKGSAGPRVAIRTDASSVIGSGHVMRCLCLADELRKRGADVSFVMRDLQGNLANRVRASGYDVAMLDAPLFDAGLASAMSGETYPEADDASATCTALDAPPDWVVVDHYRLGRTWEAAIRRWAPRARMLSIDDLADRPHDCDVLLDQNLVEGMDTRYDGLVGSGALRLIGPHFALLRPEYRTARAEVSRDRPRTAVLVYFGAADTALTSMAARAFRALRRDDLKLDIVLDRANPQNDEVRAICATVAGATVHEQLPDLAAAMVRADVCLGASGSTSWERLCLGLSSIVVTMAENQVPIAAEMARRGLAIWLGHADTIGVEGLTTALSDALAEHASPERAAAMMEVVDGWGVDRVCDAIVVRTGKGLNVREVRAEDSQMLLSWANDADTRRHSFNQHAIRADEHAAWFARRLANPDVAFYIVETHYGIPAGQVRFERKQANIWEISFLLAPLYRGRGLGQSALDAALQKFGQTLPKTVVIGRVRVGNAASARVFRALRFDEKFFDEDTLLFERPTADAT